MLYPLQKHFKGVDNVDSVPLAPFLGPFQKKKKKFVPIFSLFFFDFFLIFWFLKEINKRLLPGIKGAMIVSFLKQVLKLFWENCKWVVLTHLFRLGVHFFSIDWGRLSFQVSLFLNTGFERNHQNLSYKLLPTSVTLFVHIVWRDLHSSLMSPRTSLKLHKKYNI